MPSEKPLSQLQSRAQVELLDAVDRLRLHGFQGELDLPQLIVCGDQSSGKSSVLEAISGVRFPASDELCTRFASELNLRRATDSSFLVTIQPAGHRSDDEKKKLKKFKQPEGLTKPEDFATALEAATKHLKLLGNGDSFLEDKVVAFIRGPNLPPLTLVDLPGIIHASNKDQGVEDILRVKRIVESYMAMPSSIILAVLAADNNFANQVVLQLARVADPQLQRTLGIITKPDRVEAGSRSEASCIEYAQNRAVHLDLGWHVLKNRSFENMDATPDERNTLEAEFFNRPSWRQLAPDLVGVFTLRDKLSHILLGRLQRGIPTLVADIKHRITGCETTAEKLGEPKQSEMEQRCYLIQLSQNLHKLIGAGLEGSYRDAFFEELPNNANAARRLRARMRDILEKYSEYIHATGCSYGIITGGDATTPPQTFSVDFSPKAILQANRPMLVTRPVFVGAIASHMQRNRGREPEGFVAPDVVADIFHTQSAPWQGITAHFTNECCELVRCFFEEALSEVAPPHISTAVLELHVSAQLEASRKKVNAKLEELLKPYLSGDCITTNKHRLRDAIQRRRMEHPSARKSEVARRKEQSTEETEAKGSDDSSPEADPSAWDVYDFVMAYYEIAIGTFTDNVAVLAVENCLLEDLRAIFTPTTIAMLDSETVHELTAEPQSVQKDREMNARRMRTLRDILKVCTKHGNRLRAFDDAHQSLKVVQPVSHHQQILADGHEIPAGQSSEKLANPSAADDHGLLADNTQEEERPSSRARAPLREDLATLTPPQTPPSSSGPKTRNRGGSRHRRSPLSSTYFPIGSDMQPSHIISAAPPPSFNLPHEEEEAL